LGREILGEALAVTVSGGLAGIAVAFALGLGIDGWAGRQGQQLFLFSPRLLAGALVFSALLGAGAAVYATLRVVRLSPAEAIRRGA
jgi:ABC-type antimicrobial peptide transport system permease subunit